VDKLVWQLGVREHDCDRQSVAGRPDIGRGDPIDDLFWRWRQHRSDSDRRVWYNASMVQWLMRRDPDRHQLSADRTRASGNNNLLRAMDELLRQLGVRQYDGGCQSRPGCTDFGCRQSVIDLRGRGRQYCSDRVWRVWNDASMVHWLMWRHPCWHQFSAEHLGSSSDDDLLRAMDELVRQLDVRQYNGGRQPVAGGSRIGYGQSRNVL
jgi:hypothetical protein